MNSLEAGEAAAESQDTSHMARRFPLISLVLLALLALVPAASAREFASPHEHGAEAGPAESPEAALRKADALSEGRGIRTGRELTPALKELAAAYDELSPADRRRARRLLARPTMGEAVQGEDAYNVPEDPRSPFCTERFCVHWVSAPGDPDAPPLADPNGNGIPDYVEAMAREFEFTAGVENGLLGWRPPKPDARRGGDDRTDVYIKQLGSSGIFGYAAPDPGQRTETQHAYLVMDNDYRQEEYRNYPNFLEPLQVTAAHEYNHVLQFGYDVQQDYWLFESTAVWMEDRVYDNVNDYVNYLRPRQPCPPACGWTQLAQIPITRFNSGDTGDPLNVKGYGDAVFQRWIDQRYGPDPIRGAWERSLVTAPKSFAPGALDASLQAAGAGGFFNVFTQFAVETAEWRSATSGFFEEGPDFPDMARAVEADTGRQLTIAADQEGASGQIDHTSYALVNVQPTREPRIKVVGEFDRETASAIAIVGRTGDPVTGEATVAIARLPKGGRGIATLENPGRFSRITAVLVNSDITVTDYSGTLGDWVWAKDAVDVSARVSTDFRAPTVRRRTPGSRARGVSRRPRIVVQFSEPVGRVSTRTVRLLRGSSSVRAAVRYDSRRRRVTITPRARLRASTRYTVDLSRTLADAGGNVLPSAQRRWSFTTGRK